MNDREASQANKNTYILFAILVGAALLYQIVISPESVTIDYEKTAEDYSAILLVLFVVAVIAERFVEVLISASHEPRKQELILQIEKAKAQGKTDEQIELNQKLNIHRAQKERVAMRISFVIGLFVAFTGLGVLGEIIDTQELSGFSRVLFLTTDCVVTAGLIAGGSKGINRISKTIKAGLGGNNP